MYVIRNAAGAICGLTTAEPGAENRHPDGVLERERTTFIEDGKESAELIVEMQAFRAEQAAKVDLSQKRVAALLAMENERLAAAAADENAPEAVRDYVAAKERAS